MFKKIIWFGVLILVFLAGLLFYQRIKFYDGKLHVVFCDVGQGDAIFIRTPNGLDILVDGGPNDSVLSCLSNHMPVWDRTIELVILTHPHTDHFFGLHNVLKRYNVLSFDSEKLDNKALGFAELINEVKQNKIPLHYLFSGDSFKTNGGINIKILAPTKEFLAETSPNGMIGENNEFASLISLVSYGSFKLLLTGDTQADELSQAISQYSLTNLSVLQVPHHGSKTGLSLEILNLLKPKVAVISVGKNNRYGHPTPFVLDLLGKVQAKILRTDQKGEIEVISDGKTWQVN
ncbi:MAG: MBL fold metallo-hydrolase [Candidatus Levybacteria bacterium]|nr:MBL fold metallo-hydrolase [Candidatus Levybacteria bacterium]